LKPKTPGRVVEFASSALSPLQQAEARAQKRAGIVPSVQLPPPNRVYVTQLDDDEDKENSEYAGSEHGDTTESVSSDSSPIEEAPVAAPATKQQRPAPEKTEAWPPACLSLRVWSRNHWLYLDALVQYRRKQPFPDEVILPQVKGMCDGFLDRLMDVEEGSMYLEQWHLDVIEAFHSQVGGWNKDLLVRRLFSLLVGEKLRLEGKMGSHVPADSY